MHLSKRGSGESRTVSTQWRRMPQAGAVGRKSYPQDAASSLGGRLASPRRAYRISIAPERWANASELENLLMKARQDTARFCCGVLVVRFYRPAQEWGDEPGATSIWCAITASGGATPG